MFIVYAMPALWTVWTLVMLTDEVRIDDYKPGTQILICCLCFLYWLMGICIAIGLSVFWIPLVIFGVPLFLFLVIINDYILDPYEMY